MILLFSPYFMLGLFLASIITALTMGILSLSADKIIKGPPKSLWGLKASMTATSAAVILGSLAIVYGISLYLNNTGAWLYGVVFFVILFMILQWLFSPYIINAGYRTRTPTREEAWLVSKIEQMASEAGLSKPPKLMIAEVEAPNAFAYGSPLTGNFVAVTKGLLDIMPKEEIVAVIGHELGHLKHRDVPAILALSLIPVAIFYLGRMLLMWGWLAGGDRRNNSVLYYLGLGIVLVVVGFIFQFLVTHFNRLREYYADAFSAQLTKWPRSLQRALARLTVAYKEYPELSAKLNKSAAMLLIVNYLVNVTGHMAVDPYDGMGLWFPRRRKPIKIDVDIDLVVEELMNRKESSAMELFSSHPPVSKRLRFLENLREKVEYTVPIE